MFDATEEYIDYFETQLDPIGKVSRQNYLPSQMGTSSSS